MYQLSHLLSEQKLLLGFLATSVLGDDTPIVTETDTSKDREEQEEELRQKIASISERVEGCTVCFSLLNIHFLTNQIIFICCNFSLVVYV